MFLSRIFIFYIYHILSFHSYLVLAFDLIIVKTDNSFPRQEKLKSRKMIEQIFSDSSVVKAYPIRIQFSFHERSEFPRAQVSVSVSKRNFKSAVDRNRIKRQLREIYRLNKSILTTKLEEADKYLAMMIIYSSHKKMPYSEMESLVIKALKRIKI